MFFATVAACLREIRLAIKGLFGTTTDDLLKKTPDHVFLF